MTDLSRYDRQIRFAPIGEAGQHRLAAGRVLVCGCGALGSVVANLLVRAGVGHVRIVDRDFVELSNLQRQMLFDEADAAQVLPKAIAAAAKLRAINSQVTVEPIVADVSPANVLELAAGVDLILDGTDNFETRFLLNDVALHLNLPWVYGGCLGAEGQSMTIVPGRTPCLRCLIADTPPAGTMPTCDTAGIVGPIIDVIGSVIATEGMKLLMGQLDSLRTTLLVVDLWENRWRELQVAGLQQPGECVACGQRRFEWLAGERGGQAAVLCGRNSVQISPGTRQNLDLADVAQRLEGIGRVDRNAFLLRFAVDGYLITLFPDGRAIVGGTDDVAIARTVYARYVGA